MKQNNIDTVLFDLDGTLINTYELILQSFLHTFREFGFHQIKKEDCYSFIGPSLDETFSKISPEQADEMIACYREYNDKFHDELVKEFDGVRETVEALSVGGYKLAVVSTKIRKMVLKGLKTTGLYEYFPVVVSLDDVKNAKPNPEPLIKAMDKLGAKPEHTIMVGDSYHDILGAKNTGVRSVGVSWTIQGKDYLQKLGPDYMIDHMKELLPIVGVK